MARTASVGAEGSAAQDALPLEGVRVADFTWIVAGPQCTRILADLGADVVRIENESYLDSLRMAVLLDTENLSYNQAGMFNAFNRNKRSLGANLHHPSGRKVVERLIAGSDVVIENYSAGAFERMGFGMERLRELNPDIIYLSLSGFGHYGRDASYITWGPTAQAVSGVTAMSGLPDDEPAGWGFSYLDHTAGYYGAIAVLLALRQRAAGRRGQYIDLSQVETGMTLAGLPMLDFQVNGRHYERIGNRSRYPAVAPHGTYRCADSEAGQDRWIAIAAETEEQWAALCDVLGSRELPSAARFAAAEARLANQDALDEAITGCTRGREARELMYALQAAGVPAGVAQTTEDKTEHDEQLAARNFYRIAAAAEIPEHRHEGLPMLCSRTRWDVHRGAPSLGEHTAEILTELLGYTIDEVDQLRAEAAVQ